MLILEIRLDTVLFDNEIFREQLCSFQLQLIEENFANVVQFLTLCNQQGSLKRCLCILPLIYTFTVLSNDCLCLFDVRRKR